ncbi:MAG TPA: hypothetical protein VD866_08060 [Urbifossiella sp.]|nr:hypothetical protein [Urbifossiella sp.]
MIDPHRASRFGYDGKDAPLRVSPPLAAVTFLPPPADDVIALRFGSSVDALTFADWWGQVGHLNFSDYYHRWRVPVAPKE